MEVLKEDFRELEIGASVESFQRLLDSQQAVFHSQVDQLQRIVVTQCKLTGVNPLSQEMAAGALSIRIGKRPRDLLNPKAVKYMQSVFSIKDAISKKESREISALFGVSVTQVRDFFVSQRSRVRRIVRLSRERSIRSNACKESVDAVATPSYDPTVSVDPVPLNSIDPTNVEDGPSSSTQDDVLPGIEDSDKQFVQNIFSLMQKKETFSGQVKLMEWILRIQNTSVLCWFLTKGGVMILATWLSQAAVEEQTSVLHVILKVLCHLPLHKALPVHMSIILQSVNKLRFYRAQDISNRAKVLLSGWSKLLARTQALKRPNGVKSLSDSQTDVLLKQSIYEIMNDGSWQLNIDNLEDVLTPSKEILGNNRKLESSQTLKLLPSSSDDISRKNILGGSSSQIRERRKVQLVEQPDQKGAGRSPQAIRASPVSQSRPMSTDDIQKAKMRAQFMQRKYGKTVSSTGSIEAKTQNPYIPLESKVSIQPKTEEPKNHVIHTSKNTNRVEVCLDPKIRVESKESPLVKCKRIQIQWQTPPAIKLNDLWSVGVGENSKEVEIQKNRHRREKETIYRTIFDIPSNPKEPWDLEMDYDDTLTPEIPTEQLPDTDGTETQVADNQGGNTAVPSVSTSSQSVGASTAEPDLELLAVLLKNPELVFALTSGQAGNFSSEETVKLLDLIKAGGAGLMDSANGLGRKVEKVEVSLPSPTPSSETGTSGWKPEAAKNPFSRRSSMANGVSQPSSRVATTFVLPQIPASSITVKQQSTVPPLSPQLSAAIPPQTTTVVPEQYSFPLIPSLHQNSITTTPIIQASALAPPSTWVEGTSNTKLTSNVRHEGSTPFPSNPTLQMPKQLQIQPQPQPQPARQPLLSDSPFPTSVYSEPSVGKPISEPDSWRTRQGLSASYPYQANENNYRSVGQPHLPPGPWGRIENVDDEEFESWSPENSPRRTEYMRGRNYHDRINNDRGYGLDHRPRHWNGDNNRHGSRRWQDRRR